MANSEWIEALAARTEETRAQLEALREQGEVDEDTVNRAMFTLGTVLGLCVKARLPFPDLTVGQDLEGRVTFAYQGGVGAEAWYVLHRLFSQGPVKRLWRFADYGPVKREVEFWDASGELETVLIAAHTGALSSEDARLYRVARDAALSASPPPDRSSASGSL